MTVRKGDYNEIVVEIVKMVDAIKDFNETSSILSLKMTKTIERFESSSSKLGWIMIFLTGVIAFLTVVMIFK